MCTPDSVDKLYQEFKAWWGERVEDQISKGEDDAITDTEFASAEERFRKKYSHSILSTKNPELSQNMRESLMGEVFSEQLRFIELSDDEIIDAVDDYYFAKSNRSDWLEKSMVYPDELNSYQDGLKNYWRKEFNRNKRDLTDESTDTELLLSGRKTYETCSKLERHISETKKIDTDVNRITSGSFHILANNEDNAEIPTIGWHPKYEEKLKDKKKEGV